MQVEEEVGRLRLDGGEVLCRRRIDVNGELIVDQHHGRPGRAVRRRKQIEADGMDNRAAAADLTTG